MQDCQHNRADTLLCSVLFAAQACTQCRMSVSQLRWRPPSSFAATPAKDSLALAALIDNRFIAQVTETGPTACLWHTPNALEHNAGVACRRRPHGSSSTCRTRGQGSASSECASFLWSVHALLTLQLQLLGRLFERSLPHGLNELSVFFQS